MMKDYNKTDRKNRKFSILWMVLVLISILGYVDLKGQTVLLNDDFEDNDFSDWTVLEGSWAIVDTISGSSKELIRTNTDKWSTIQYGDATWDNYTFETTVRPFDALGTPGLSILEFRFLDLNNYYYLAFYHTTASSQLKLRKRLAGTATDIVVKDYAHSIYQPYDIKISVIADTFKVYVDNVLELEGVDGDFSSGGIALATYYNTTSFDDVIVTSVDIEAPTTPGNLISTDVTDKTVSLSWDASTDNEVIAGYVVYIDNDSSDFTTSTTYDATGLTSETAYDFFVRAVDVAGNLSISSDTISETTLATDLTPPSVPTGLVTNTTDMYSISVSWEKSTDNVSVSQYYIYLDTDSIDAITDTVYVFTGLTYNTSYDIRVEAVDGSGNKSGQSDVYTVSTLDDTEAPSAPAGLVASSITMTGCQLDWNPATDNIGVTAYVVYQDNDSIDQVTDTTYMVTGLDAVTTYAFTIKAKDANGNISLAGNQVDIITLDTQAPSTPTGLAASNITMFACQLDWNPSTDNVGVVAYVIYQDGDSINQVTDTTYVVSGLASAASFTFTVKAKDNAGNISLASLQADVTTLSDTEAPSTPSNLVATNVTTSGCNLSWNAATDNVGVEAYVIYQDGDSVDQVVVTSYSVTGLTFNSAYAFTVIAKDAVGNHSAASNQVDVSTQDNEAPTAPANLTATNVTISGCDLSWDASTDNVAVTAYVIYQNGDSVDQVNNTTYGITGLTVNTNYVYTVKAKDVSGNISTASNQADVSTADTESPSAPANLAASNITSESCELSWDASTDNVAVIAYVIYQDGDSIDQVTETTYSLSGLVQETNYEIAIKAKDAAGNISDASNTAYVSTLALGIEMDGNVNISVYPNPASEFLQVNLSGISGDVKIEMIDMQGKTMFSTLKSNNNLIETITLPMNGIPAGIYNLNVVHDMQVVYSQITIVK